MRTRLLSIVLMLAFTYSPQSVGEDRSWASAAPLHADPEALIQAFAAQPADAQFPARSLYYAEKLEVDKRGRAHYSSHHIYQLYKRQDGLGTEQVYWQPAFSKRPKVKARVIHPDGKVFELDPRTLVETTLGTQDQLLYVDTRSLSAPLPMVVDGAVVEEFIEYQSEEPWAGAGESFTFNSLGFEKGATTRFEVVVPEGHPLHIQGGTGDFVRTEELIRGKRVLTWERVIAQNPSMDMTRTPELRDQVRVQVATAASWEAIAQSALARMDPPAASPALASLAQQTIAGASSREEKIRLLTELVHERVRYVAIELGVGALIPRPAERTLDQGYGDCKDKATLLITLLRAVGIESSLVLLNAGRGEDSSPNLPSVDAFNHVIVQVHGDAPLFIDATDPYTPVGELPLSDQGRNALQLRPGISALIELPRATSTENVVRMVRILKGDPTRATQARDEVSARGWLASMSRARMDSPDESEETVELDEGPDGPGGWVTLHELDPKQGPPLYLIAGSAAEVDCEDLASFGQMGSLRRATPVDGKVEVVPERVEAVWRYEVPPDYTFAEAPEATQTDLGKVKLYRTAGRTADGALEVVCGWEVTEDLTAEEADQLKKDLKAWDEAEEPFDVFVADPALAAAHRGDLAEGLALLAQRPSDPQQRLLHALALKEMGLLDGARRELQALAKDNPDLPAFWWELASLQRHDQDDSNKGPSIDREGAIRSLRRLMELEPDQTAVRNLLLTLLPNEGRSWLAPGTLTEARALLEQTLKPLNPEKPDPEATERGAYLEMLLVDRDLDTLLRTPHLNPQDPEHMALRLAAITMRDGTEAGLAELKRLRGQGLAGSRDGAYTAVATAGRLTEQREHALAQAWGEEARKLGISPWALTSAGLDHPISRWEDVVALMPPEESLALRAVLAVERPDLRPRLLPGQDLHPNAELEHPDFPTLGGPDEWLMDQFATRSKAAVVDQIGDAVRVRIETRDPDAEEDEDPDEVTIFLVRNQGVLQMRAYEQRPSELGEAALEQLAEGDLITAQALLDWALDTKGVRQMTDKRLWGISGERGAPSAKAFAALLVARASSASALRAQQLMQETSRLKPLRDLDALNKELATLLSRLDKNKQALALFESLRKKRPDDKELAYSTGTALASLGRGKDLKALQAEYLKRWGEDDNALYLQIEGSLASGALEEAFNFAEDLDKRRHPTASSMLNNAAWGALFTEGADLERAVKDIRRSKDLSDRDNVRHTLACLLLETDELPEAVELLTQARQEPGPLEEHWWVVVGRLAQLGGLNDEARAAYARIPASDGTRDTRALADRYLAQMKP